VKIVTETYRVH